MNCNVVKDLLPLYIDGCCSAESAQAVKEHIASCPQCKSQHEVMAAPAEVVEVPKVPTTFSKLNDWKASVMQSVLLFVSFGLITIGVALEAASPSGLLNGFWAFNLVIPATGFLLSLANWYFVRVYKSRKAFSNCSLLITLGLTICAIVWAIIHYEVDLLPLFAGVKITVVFETIVALLALWYIGILLTVIFCVLSKTLSNQYAKMLGKE